MFLNICVPCEGKVLHIAGLLSVRNVEAKTLRRQPHLLQARHYSHRARTGNEKNKTYVQTWRRWLWRQQRIEQIAHRFEGTQMHRQRLRLVPDGVRQH